MHPDVIAEPAVVALPRADAAQNYADPAHDTMEIFLEINIKNILARNILPIFKLRCANLFWFILVFKEAQFVV